MAVSSSVKGICCTGMAGGWLSRGALWAAQASGDAARAAVPPFPDGGVRERIWFFWQPRDDTVGTNPHPETSMTTSIARRFLAIALCTTGCAVAAEGILPEAVQARSPGYAIRGMPVESIEFMDFFRSADAAIQAAASIDDRMFLVNARPAAAGDGWVVTARYRELPDPAVLELHERQMAVLGKRLGGHGLTPGFRSSRFSAAVGPG